MSVAARRRLVFGDFDAPPGVASATAAGEGGRPDAAPYAGNDAIGPPAARRPPSAGPGAVRFSALILLGAVVQAGLSARFGPATPDVLLVCTAAVGFAAGDREVGAAFGFAAGLAADVAVSTPFGVGALVFTVVGWLAGNPQPGRPPAPSALRRLGRDGLRGAAACLAGGTAVAAVGSALGAAPPPSDLAGVLATSSAASAVPAVVAFPLARRLAALRGAP